MSSEQEEYEYFKNAREYLDYFYSDLTGAKCPDEGEWMPWSMEQFHRTFSQDKGYGGRLLDVGSGPTVYQLVSASRVFPEIVCSDFHKGALAEIKKWKESDTCAFDWSPFFQHVAGLEGSSWESRQDQLRSAIKDVVPCDVFNPNPLHPGMFQPFDAIISAYCLESACYDKGRSAYTQAVRNISTLLKSGGHLVLQTYIGVTYWIDKEGNKTPDSLCLDTDFVLKTLSEAGFTELETSEYKTPEREKCYYSDIKGILHVTGKKI
ncbi:nicotinamide N-methyltransferase-like [Branchiostoma floridae]|uniref:Nicotinamide N-methyltransferase-like n=1 Tax=Branchiostoma floridae TaxID=7739 RepID=A0A9J7KBX3_BRAFL|nr:nicotinamide N-methyltransferase-like [Branchiostoma floridae]